MGRSKYQCPGCNNCSLCAGQVAVCNSNIVTPKSKGHIFSDTISQFSPSPSIYTYIYMYIETFIYRDMYFCDILSFSVDPQKWCAPVCGTVELICEKNTWPEERMFCYLLTCCGLLALLAGAPAVSLRWVFFVGLFVALFSRKVNVLLCVECLSSPAIMPSLKLFWFLTPISALPCLLALYLHTLYIRVQSLSGWQDSILCNIGNVMSYAYQSTVIIQYTEWYITAGTSISQYIKLAAYCLYASCVTTVRVTQKITINESE